MAANPGAKLQKFIPKNYIPVIGKNIPAIHEAFNRNIQETETLIQACIDQLFLNTASGNFLVQLGEEQGFVMPANSGLDIRAYKVLVPIMVAAPKQVRISIDQLVQAFYQNERTRPVMLSAIAGPYNLNSGDDLTVETESGSVNVSIVDGQVSDLTNVSAQEIAAVLNVSQELYLAEAVTDRISGLSSVRIISNTFGTGAFIKVTGGKLQNVLQLPNLAETSASSSTTWNLTKTSIYTDELRFTWDGIGVNPDVYKAKAGDVVTIRGLVDGTEDFSLINGSYELVDVGYDYFVIRNDLFDVTTATLTQGVDNAIIFTKADKIILFDSPEFAYTSETIGQTITVTVPVVPPLARRFLQGSAHVRGFSRPVLDFTRTNIQVSVDTGEDRPVGDNWFVYTSKHQRPDFSKKYFKTTIVDGSLTSPSYTLNVIDEEFSVLPFTVPTTIGTIESVFASVDSSSYKVVFPDFRHGLQNTWGFTLAGMTGEANILAGDLNKEHQVRTVLNDNEVEFTITDSNGDEVPFDGIAFGNSDVYRHAANQADGSDFYMDFGTSGAAIASGLTPGLTFRLDTILGSDVDPFLAGLLRFQLLTVVSVTGALVNFSSGLGTGPQGLVITAIPGTRSGFIGGATGTYHLDKTSDHNIERVLQDLSANFIGYTPSSNTEFLGPHIFDPDGDETNLTVSRFLVKSEDSILRGESRETILVDESELGDPENFPQTGKIVIDYGTSTSEGPIDYLAYVRNLSTTQILIDPAYQFKKSHTPGAQIQFVHQALQYTPTIDGEDYPFYLTGTTAARNTLFKLIDLLVASGIFVEADVIAPDLRYNDTSIDIFE